MGHRFSTQKSKQTNKENTKKKSIQVFFLHSVYQGPFFSCFFNVISVRDPSLLVFWSGILRLDSVSSLQKEKNLLNRSERDVSNMTSVFTDV